jgi:hypothetical protein
VTLICEAQERVWYKLHPQSPCPGVNYSLFIMLLKKMVPMESNGQPGAALAVYPLLALQSVDPYCVFHVFPCPIAK